MAKTIRNEKFRFEFSIEGDKAKKELIDLERSTRKLNESNKQLRLEKKRLERAGKKESAEYQRVTSELKENNAAIKANKARMKELRSEIGLTGLTMRQLRAEASRLKLQLNNMTPGSAEYKKLNNDLKKVNARMAELRGNARATKSTMSRMADGFNRYSAMGIGVIAMLTGVVFKLQQFIDFNGKLDGQMSNVMKTTGMTRTEVEDLAKSFGLLQTRTSRINLLKIAEQGGRIGLAKNEIADFVAIMDKAVVSLGDDFPGGAAETAHSLGQLKQLFEETKKMDVDQAYNSIGSSINELGASGLASAPNIAEFTARVGALNDVVKPSISDSLALGAAFEESGIKAEIASRAYGIFLTQSTKRTRKFAQVMGISQKEVEDMINTDPTQFFLRFAKGLDSMKATDLTRTLDALGLSATGVQKILGSASANAELFADKLALSSRAMEEGTSLIDEYNIKNNDLEATLEKVGKRFRGIFTSDALVNFLKGAVEWFGKFIGATDDATGSVTRFRDFLVFLIKIVALVTAGILSYNAAMKLHALWTTRAITNTKLFAFWTRASNLAMRTGRGIALLFKAAIALVTGSLKRAKEAMVAFNAVTKLSPWGLLIGLAAALTAAYFAFRESAEEAKTAQDNLNEAFTKAKVEVSGQIEKVKALDSIVRDETKSEKARLAAMKELNKIVPHYNEDLDLSREALEKSKIALDEYNASLETQARAQALSNLMTAKAKELEQLKADDVMKHVSWYESLWLTVSQSKDMYSAEMRIGAENRAKAISKVTHALEKYKEAQVALFVETANKKTPLEQQIDSFITLRDMWEEGSAAYLKFQKQIDELRGKQERFNALDDDKDKTVSAERQRLIDIQSIRDEAARKAIEMIEDDFTRERALEKHNHAIRIRDLKDRLTSEEELARLPEDIRQNRIAVNKATNKLIENEEQAHQFRMGAILESGAELRMQEDQEAFERGRNLRRIAFEQELSQLDISEKEKQERRDAFNEKERQKEIEHLQELIHEFNAILASEELEGMDLSILTPEQRDQILQYLEQIRLKMAELKNGGKPEEEEQDVMGGAFGNGAADGVDVLGFTIGDYMTTIQNLDSVEGKIRAVAMAVGALSNAYKMYADMQAQNDRAEMQKFEHRQERRAELLQRRLDNGQINQRQYNEAMAEMDRERARRQAEMEYRQAKRQRTMAIANIITNQGMAIAQAVVAKPPLGLPWTPIIAGLMATQIAMVAGTELPDRSPGFESGYYPMLRAQDGKRFNVRSGGDPVSQMVSTPTHFIAGEGGMPEMIIDGASFRSFTPELKQALYRQLHISPGYQDGYYRNNTGEPRFRESDTTAAPDNSELVATLAEVRNFLARLDEQGVTAYMDRSMQTARRIKEDQERLNKIERR